MMMLTGLAVLLLAGPADNVRAAETLAAEAISEASTRPTEALEKARRALSRTEEFDPIAFVTAGRRGEVVEDEYQVARASYRRHRARLFAAMGECLARAGQPVPATRYFRRSLDLDADGPRARSYARLLITLKRHREALDLLLGGGRVIPESLALAGQAADALGLPCLQCELDRVRLSALGTVPRPEVQKTPFRSRSEIRLSTGAHFRIAKRSLTLIYVAEPPCRTCSADIDALARLAPGSDLFLLPFLSGEDLALRQILRSYRHDWPFLLGPNIARDLGVPAPSLLSVAREGWSVTLLRPPFNDTLPAVLGILRQQDVAETTPRPAWNGLPPRNDPPPERTGLLGEGIAPGEDEPFPQPFVDAVEAFRGRRFSEALKLFESLERLGDGWLLTPEARFNRALCLARLGRGEEARKLLLRTGDSRFQEAVDRALEAVESGSAADGARPQSLLGGQVLAPLGPLG